MTWLWRLATSPSVEARVREQARATLLLILLARLLASGGGERPERGRFAPAASWAVPRRRRPQIRSSLTGRRPRG